MTEKKYTLGLADRIVRVIERRKDHLTSVAHLERALGVRRALIEPVLATLLRGVPTRLAWRIERVPDEPLFYRPITLVGVVPPVARSSISLTYRGQTKTLDEWAALTGLSYMTLYSRTVDLRWAPKRIIETPLRRRPRPPIP